ncbi:MAG: HesA/MoeB/ThiF family protein [Rickettsiales bacterium]|nr:HesA/MoeB/ThiF family protein [Rickettsiales bacterium]
MPLNDTDKHRFARQIMMDEIGEEGQERLSNASVLIIGAGGLGSASASYLAAAGIGRLGLIDNDHVELSNLQRQIIHEYGDIGRMKIESAGDRISELNPFTHVDLFSQRVRAENAESFLKDYDVVLDGTDNFETRMVINKACVKLDIPLVTAAVKGFEGQLSVFASHKEASQPCYQCFVPETPPEANNCTEVGVIGPLCGVLGSMQAVECMKLILGLSTLTGQLLRYDIHTHQHRVSQIKRDPECIACGDIKACA